MQGLPLVKPPYSRITAIDLDRGEFRWQVPFGATPDNIRNNPALKGVTMPRTGQSGIIGTLSTKSLVIAGESRVTTTSTGVRGAMLRAYDKNDGKGKRYLLRGDKADCDRLELLRTRPHPFAPSGEIGYVVRYEVGKGRPSLRTGRRIEHHLDKPRDGIIFDNQRCLRGQRAGSRSIFSAANTRLCIL